MSIASRLLLATALIAVGPAAATDPSERDQGYDADAAAAIAAIEARQAKRDDGTLNLPTLRVRGRRRYNDATGTRLMGESAPEGGVLFTDVDEGWRAKHQW